jgi:hypothetical protein
MQSWEIEDICFEQGHASGLMEGKAEIILNMNKKGYTIEQIADVTEKSPEEIIDIIEKHGAALV